MKKITKWAWWLMAAAMFFTACSPAVKEQYETVPATETVTIGTLQVAPNGWAFCTYGLSEYGNTNAKISISCEMEVNNKSGKSCKLMWQIAQEGYPVVSTTEFEPGTSKKTVTGSTEGRISLAASPLLYLSTNGLTASEFEIKISNLILTIEYDKKVLVGAKTWDQVASLKETWVDSGIFSHFGIAVEMREITNPTKADLLKRHASSITMGNEMKPQFILWGTPSETVDFTSSKGKTIKVPANFPTTNNTSNGFGGMDTCLKFCKDNGLKMRGHVLVWHSQTPEWFFRTNYSESGDLVSKDEMDARQEWYIKTVLEHVKNWEKENDYRAIYAWDVVNEACADDASGLRGETSGTSGKDPSNGGSRWYQIYNDNSFITNAFVYANTYAPKDVKLCYNDYNEYMGSKTGTILKLIEDIQKTPGARIDVMGMQSHVGYGWPKVSEYESALKKYIALGLDIHVTELDIGADKESSTEKKGLAKLYGDYFKLFKKYAKSGENHGITSVTVWGINDEDSWLKYQNNYKGKTPYPLLFEKSGSDIIAKDALIAVLNAAKEE